MAVSMITGPDGAKYRVTHPEDATREQILARVAQQQQPAAQPTTEQLREQVGTGANLQVGIPGLTPVWDTGVELPQGATEFLAGMGRRASEIGSLGTHETPKEAARLLDDSGYATAGGVAADVGALYAGGHLLRGAGATGNLASKALTNPQTALQAATGGAVYGAATSNDRLGGAIAGGVGGGLGHGAAKALGAVVSPNVDDAARAMIAKGDTLTPGEILGGAVKRAEDAATSVPVLGDAIRSAQRRSLSQYSRGVVDDALAPIGRRLDDSVQAGSEAIGKAQRMISEEFDTVLDNMNVRLDQQFANEAVSLRSLVAELPEKEAREFDRLFTRSVASKFDNPNQLMLGRTFRESGTSLRESYQKLLKSGDHYQRQLGNALRELNESLLNLGRRQNPELAPRLDAVKQSYAMMKRIEDAAGYVGAEDRVFTPSHMLNAIKRNTSKSRFAAGEGFDQAATEQAKGVLSQSIPDSGTTGRAITNMMTVGGGAMYAPQLLAPMLGGAALYTRPGQKVAQAALTQRPAGAAAVRGLLDELAVSAGLIGTGAGLNSQ